MLTEPRTMTEDQFKGDPQAMNDQIKCAECGGPMPSGAHPRAVTCSVKCRGDRLKKQRREGSSRYYQRLRDGLYTPKEVRQ